MKSLLRTMLAALLLLSCSAAFAADEDDDSDKPKNVFGGLELRNLGPAFMSGRIADIAINPEDPSQWYVAVGSGNVWRTDNGGTNNGGTNNGGTDNDDENEDENENEEEDENENENENEED